MLAPTVLFFLPLIAAAQQQAFQPYLDKAQDLFQQAKGYLPGGILPSPVDAGAAKVAEFKCEKITVPNWQRKLSPKVDGPEEWMVYVSGNQSCYGNCAEVDQAWNRSIAILAAEPNPPHLATLNCDVEKVLCAAWFAAVPSIWHFSLPTKPDSTTPAPPTSIHVIPLNHTTITTNDIVDIHREKTYLAHTESTGAFHPIDGALAHYQLLMPFGYVLWGFTVIPSWLFMIAISFISRQMMSRRMARAPGLDGPATAAPGQAVPQRPAPPAGGRPKKA